MKTRWLVVVLAAMVTVGISSSAHAQATAKAESGDWKFEITPYLWAMGIDGTIKVRDREVEFDRSFSDLVENVDLALEALGIVQYKRFVGFVQYDTFSLSKESDEFDQPRAQQLVDKVELDTTFVTFGVGYTFDILKNSRLGVLVGARAMDTDATVTALSGASENSSATLWDPVLAIRPDFGLLKGRLRFKPLIDIGGGGDSDLIWEFQPNLQWNFTEHFSARLGYRILHYEFTDENNIESDVDYSGAMLGVSFFF